MALTPNDIQNHNIKAGGMGGYNKKETDDFLEEIRMSWEATVKENSELKNKVAELSVTNQHYKEQESTLQKLLIKSEQDAEKKLADAQEEANKIIAEAEAQANETITKANSDAENVNAKVQEQVDAAMASTNEERDNIINSANAQAEAIQKEANDKLEEANSKLSVVQSEADEILASAKKESETILADANTKSTSLVSESQAKADKMVKDAEEKSAKIISEAEVKAENMLSDKTAELEGLSKSVEKLDGLYASFKDQFKEMLNKNLKAVEADDFDVKVDGIKVAKEDADAVVAKNKKAVSEANERINAFDSAAEELDDDGLNASGLNFDVERSTTGIIVDDAEAMPSEPAPAPEPTDAKPAAEAKPAVAAPKTGDDYDAFSSLPSMDDINKDSSSPFTFTQA